MGGISSAFDLFDIEEEDPLLSYEIEVSDTKACDDLREVDLSIWCRYVFFRSVEHDPWEDVSYTVYCHGFISFFLSVVLRYSPCSSSVPVSYVYVEGGYPAAMEEVVQAAAIHRAGILPEFVAVAQQVVEGTCCAYSFR